MTEPRFIITKAASFEAAHFMPWQVEGHPYRAIHGHSFRIEVAIAGPRHGTRGWVADLGEVDAALKALAGELDHGLLNEIEGLEVPTLETLCQWAATRLKPQFPGLIRVTLSRPSLSETCSLELDG